MHPLSYSSIIYLPIDPPISPFTHQFTNPSTYPPHISSTYQSISPPINPLIHSKLLTHQSIHPPVPIHSLIHPNIHLLIIYTLFTMSIPYFSVHPTGHVVLGGEHMFERSVHLAGKVASDSKKIFVSPSIRYAGHDTYAEPELWVLYCCFSSLKCWCTELLLY